MIWWRRASCPSFPIDRLEACPTSQYPVPILIAYDDKTSENCYNRSGMRDRLDFIEISKPVSSFPFLYFKLFRWLSPSVWFPCNAELMPFHATKAKKRYSLRTSAALSAETAY